MLDDEVWDDAAEPFAQRSVVRPAVLADVVVTRRTLSVRPDPRNALGRPSSTAAAKKKKKEVALLADVPPGSPMSSASALPSVSAQSLTCSPSSVRDTHGAAPGCATSDSDSVLYDAGLHGGDEAECGCLHALAGECTVSIPFVGYYADPAVVANMRTFYETYPAHIDAFVDMVVNKYGDGTRAPLPAAVDRLVAEEKALP